MKGWSQHLNLGNLTAESVFLNTGYNCFSPEAVIQTRPYQQLANRLGGQGEYVERILEVWIERAVADLREQVLLGE